MQQAKNLSEAFLVVREYLWDGTSTRHSRESAYICVAASSAYKDRKITNIHLTMIHEIIAKRLGKYKEVEDYVEREHNGGITPSDEDLQDYRHAWLIALSEEFADRQWWIEYRYPTWLTVYCNSSQNDEEGWTRIDRSADFLQYNINKTQQVYHGKPSYCEIEL